MKQATYTLTLELWGYWRAARYLPVERIYLSDNLPLNLHLHLGNLARVLELERWDSGGLEPMTPICLNACEP